MSRSALLVPQYSIRNHDQQMFRGVIGGHGGKDCLTEHYVRKNITAVSRKEAASLSRSAYFELPSTLHVLSAQAHVNRK